MGQLGVGQRKEDDAALADDVGILVGAKAGAAIFDDPQSARGYLSDHSVIEADDAVGHEIEEFVSVGHGPILLYLDRKNACELAVDQPVVEAIQFSAFALRVAKNAHQYIERIHDDLLGADSPS